MVKLSLPDSPVIGQYDYMRETTKAVVAQMLRAGFKRSEFTCHIERIYRAQYAKEGVRNPYDYGSVTVLVHGTFRDGVYVNSNRLIAERAEAIIATGLGVQHLQFTNGGEAYLIRTEYMYRGKIDVVDYAYLDRVVAEFDAANPEVCNA